ncbi:MAG TPA: peptide deformylase [Actinomycetota bacterium]|nr:peptide deformylase [Actinomycetota bacterium]
MAVRPVLVFPDPRLKTPASFCQDVSLEVIDVAQDLFDTMASHQGCVGLAAPQIGVSLRIIIVDVTGHPKAARSSGPLIVVDPILVAMDGSELGREGCPSLPHITANVLRAERIFLSGKSLEGRQIKAECSGFEARVIQHEIDHLDGILILDRVASPSEIFERAKKR